MSRPLMNIRTFLRGGYRELVEPTEIISGTTRLGVWLPESWQSGPRTAHPDGEDALTGVDSPVSPDANPLTGESVASERIAPVADGTGGQSGAPNGGAAGPRRSGSNANGVRRPAPTPQSVLDRAARAGRS